MIRLRRLLHLLPLLLAPIIARAQAPGAARVLVLVDTSGSMIDRVTDATIAGGDGDAASRYSDFLQANKNYYPGNIIGGLPDGMNSRLYAAKGAWRDGLYSTGDFNPGLMRYRANASCPNANYCCTPSNTVRGDCICDPDYVNNLSTVGQCGAAMGLITWAGGCGTINGSGQATSGGIVLADPAAAGGFTGSLKWVDNAEDFHDAGGVNAANPELRAAGTRRSPARRAPRSPGTPRCARRMRRRIAAPMSSST